MITQKALRPPLTAREHLGNQRTPYTANEFLADGRRVLARTSATSKATPHFVECLDGQLISIESGTLLEAASARSEVLSIFCVTYGLEEGPRRASRFRAALEFLEEHGDTVIWAGLAYDRGSMKVYREFVEFLLNHEERSGRGKIPETAVSRFLDEWGHRWI
jgi:hypothetical protein